MPLLIVTLGSCWACQRVSQWGASGVLGGEEDFMKGMLELGTGSFKSLFVVKVC